MGHPRPSRAGLIAALLLSAATLALPAPSLASDSELAQQVVVRFIPGTSEASRTELRTAAHAALDHAVTELPGMEVLTVQSGTPAQSITTLNNDSRVDFAEPNYEVDLASADTYWPIQWALRNDGFSSGVADADADADEAWPVTKGAGITVGVVDTGLDGTHPDLAANVVAGRDFVSEGGNAGTDANGHGTHVAGIIAAAQNAVGITGLAPSAKVMPLRAMSASGSGSSADIAAAFAYAGQAGLRIVNGSFASTTPSQAQQAAIAAYPATLFVVAAGNDSANIDATDGFGNRTHGHYPCAFSNANVLCVGNSDRRDVPFPTSDRGLTSVDLFAPGTEIMSTVPGASYAAMTGTSMAAPVVAGAAALVAAKNPTWTASQLKAQLLATVDHPTVLAQLSASGGRLNAARAVGVTPDPDGGPPPTPTSFAGTAATYSVHLTWSRSASSDVAGYRILQLTRSAFTGMTTSSVVLETTALEATINGLTANVPVNFRIVAFDANGNVSAESSTVSLTPGAVIPTGTPGTNDTPSHSTKTDLSTTRGTSDATEWKPTSKSTSTGRPGLVLTAPTKVKKRGKVTALGFTVASQASVVVTVSKRNGKSYRAVLTTTQQFKAGKQQLATVPTLLGRKLTRGLWRVTLKSSNQISFNIQVK